MLDWLRHPAAQPAADLAVIRVGERDLPLVIRRLPRARRMTLRLSRDGGEVCVSMPRWAREAEARAFAESRAGWLAEQASRIPERQRLAGGATLAVRGEARRIDHHPTHPRRVTLAESAIRIGGPGEGIEPRLRRWLQAEARRLFAADLADFAARADQPLPTLALSNARARWGSCSSGGVVRLNWRLVMAPDAVRRSVVAHEVAHLVHFDHSPAFHALLASLFDGDLAAANRWLKAHGRSLYAPFG